MLLCHHRGNTSTALVVVMSIHRSRISNIGKILEATAISDTFPSVSYSPSRQ